MPSAAWEKRNAAARAKGYKSYYDYRMHRYGKRPPSEEPVTGDEAAQFRGQRGAKSFTAALRKPKEIALIVETPHTVRGIWTHMDYVVTFTNADIRKYRVPLPDQLTLDAWRDAIYEREIEFIEYTPRKGDVRMAA